MSDDEGEEGTSTDIGYTRPATTRVVKVGYCGVSGLPFEYCEFVPEFPKCKEWFQQNYQSFYPEVSEEAELTELMTRLGFEGEPDANAKKAQSSKKKPTEAAEGAEEGGAEGAPAAAEGEGGGGKKKKKEAKKELLIEMTSRNKKKHVTTITGLQLFGVDEAAAAKVFGKKFACGSAFQKGKNGLPDQIEIQGNYIEELPAFILEKFKVDLDDQYLIAGKGAKKTKASEFAPAE